MSFKLGLVRARSHLIFLTGLVTAFGLVGWLRLKECERRKQFCQHWLL